MTTLERLTSQGQRLFAARSVVPFTILPLVALAMPEAWRSQSASSASVLQLWLTVAVALGLAGLTIRAAALAFAPEGTSSRDTHQMRAPSLNTTGMYSIVRNPLYVGNGLMWLGAVASIGLWWLLVMTALIYWLYIERVIAAEEQFLEGQFGRVFHEWAERTPAFLPDLSRWRPAEGRFSWRRLSTEHNGLLGFLLTITVFRLGVEAIAGPRTLVEWRADYQWLIGGLAASLLLSVALVVMKQINR